MTDFEKNLNEEDVEELDDIIYTLTDEETGEDTDFQLIARATIDDVLYFALLPLDEAENEEYYILRVSEEGEDVVFDTIEDDDEFEKVEEYFNDLLFGEVDYDEQA